MSRSMILPTTVTRSKMATRFRVGPSSAESNVILNKEKIVFSWSGGKDSAMALHEILRAGLYDVVALLTTVTTQYERICMHGVRESLLEAQAKAIGIPCDKIYMSYE